MAADLDLTDLRQRQDQVELELWAQRIAVEEGRLAMYEAEDALAVEEHREAQARFERIKPKFEEMRREYETARSAALRDGISTHRMNLKKESRAKLAELEVNYPGA